MVGPRTENGGEDRRARGWARGGREACRRASRSYWVTGVRAATVRERPASGCDSGDGG